MDSKTQKNHSNPETGLIQSEKEANNNLDATKGANLAAQAMSSRRGKTKVHPLLLAKTDTYVDDSELFQAKLTDKDRISYWQHLIKHNIKTKKKGFGFADDEENEATVWRSHEEQIAFELSHYHRHHVILWKIFRSRNWDQWTLNLFLLWIILYILLYDGWAKQFAPILVTINGSSNVLLVLPTLLMLLCQVVPFLGTVYFNHFCHDLVQFTASIDFQTWGWVCVLTTQYIEFFHYGGRNRFDKGGKCRKSANKDKLSTFQHLMNKIKPFLARYSKIQPEGKYKEEKKSDEEEENDSNESESEEEGDDENEEDSNGSSKESNSQEDDSQNSSKSEEKLKKDKKKPKEKESTSSKPKESTKQEPDINKADIENQISIKNPHESNKLPVKSSEKISNENNLISSSVKESNKLSSSSKKDVPSESIKPPISSKPNQPTISEDDNDLESGENKEEEEVKEDNYVEWDCIVCKNHNRELKYIEKPEVDIYFGEQGVYYKRLFAKLNPRSHKPACKKCYTVIDYKPPLATSHLFPHNPDPYAAFKKYPAVPRVQNGLRRDKNSLRWYYWISFWYGIMNNPSSGTMDNDWKILKYLSDTFPPIPRIELKPDEFYRVGELVECKQQKLEFSRAIVIQVRTNHTYDIKYDPGDEIRFVEQNRIRLSPQKRAFAYHVEIGLVGLVLYFPLGFLLSISTLNFGFMFIGCMVVSVLWFGIRFLTWIQYCVNYYDAGMFVLLRFSCFYMLPIFFFMIGSILGVSQASTPASWGTIAAMFIIAKFFGLFIFYMMRPPYLILGLIIFFFTSIGMILLSMHSQNPSLFMYWAIPLAPFILLTLFLKYLRRHLHNIWDVCAVIRPVIDISMYDPNILGIWKKKVLQRLGYL